MCTYFSKTINNEGNIMLKFTNSNNNYNLYDCLDDYFGKEILEHWRCDKCNNVKKNHIQHRMMNCPDTLIINLSRFVLVGYNDTGAIHKKNTSLIDFPLTLNMNKYKLTDRENNSIYQLYGVVNQIGSRNSGHYYSFCRNLKSKTDTNWYVFNDERVTKINEANIVTDRAYILFYKKM